MIIKVEYDKTDATLTLTKDTEMIAVINDNTVIDNSDTLSFEIALNVSQYQEQFLIDGEPNE
jgi:hypothetical protein